MTETIRTPNDAYTVLRKLIGSGEIVIREDVSVKKLLEDIKNIPYPTKAGVDIMQKKLAEIEDHAAKMSQDLIEVRAARDNYKMEYEKRSRHHTVEKKRNEQLMQMNAEAWGSCDSLIRCLRVCIDYGLVEGKAAQHLENVIDMCRLDKA